MNSTAPIILIVDDDPAAQEIVGSLLGSPGYDLHYASSGQRALDSAIAIRPDLILLDVMLPDLDGLQVCRLLRAHPRTAEVPVILLTALDDRDTALAGIEAGADDLLTKPFSRVELQARVRTVVRLNRYRRLIEEQERAKQAQDRLAWTLAHSHDGYLILEPSGQIVYANTRAAFYLHGGTDTQLTGRIFSELIAGRFQCEPALPWNDLLHSGSSTKRLIRPRDGTNPPLWLEVAFNGPTVDHSQLVRLTDISDRILEQHASWSLMGAISHKLRTPLMAIISSLGLMEMSWECLSDTERHAMMTIALSAARHLRNQVDLVIRIGELKRVSGEVQLAELHTLCLALADELGLTVSLPASDALEALTVPMSYDQLELIIRELFTNAQKFHPHNSPHLKIQINYEINNRIRITVSDDGVWISPELLHKVWRPFYQLEPHFTGQIDGMGTGLPMVAQLIMSSGGHCAIANRLDRPGVSISMQLPFVQTQNIPEPVWGLDDRLEDAPS